MQNKLKFDSKECFHGSKDVCLRVNKGLESIAPSRAENFG